MGYTKDKDGNWVLSDSYMSSVKEVINDCVETKEGEKRRIEFEKNWELNRENRYKDYLNLWRSLVDVFNTNEFIQSHIRGCYYKKSPDGCSDTQLWVIKSLIDIRNIFFWEAEKEWGSYPVTKDWTDKNFQIMLLTHCKDVCVKLIDERISNLD